MSKDLEQTSKHLPADMSLKEQLKRDLQLAAQGVSGSVIERIRMSAKGFTPPDGEPTDVIQGVIIDFVSSNTHYPEAFDRDNPTPPNCFATGRIPEQMAPDPSASDPQHENCRDCPKNQFESGVGRAKACKNTKVLAIMAEGSKEEDSPIWVLTIPPGSIRFFDTYVSTTLKGRYQLPPAAVVTEIHMDKRLDFAAPRFKFVRELDDAELSYFYSRKPEAEAILLQKPVMATAA